jgi:hypothetical protein
MQNRWLTIGLPDLSPDRWTNRFLAFRANHIKAPLPAETEVYQHNPA